MTLYTGNHEKIVREFAELGESGLKAWHEGYRLRAMPVLEEVIIALDSAWDVEPSHPKMHHTEVIFRLRRKRKSWNHHFCLVIHASDIHKELLTELVPPKDLDTIFRNMTESKQGWKIAAVSSYLLEKSGIYCVTLTGENTQKMDGFLNLDFTDAEQGDWYETFTCLAELADAIILYGGFGPYLQLELRWLKLVGLHSRTLVHMNWKLARLIDARTWHLLEIADAVHYTTPMAPAWRSD